MTINFVSDTTRADVWADICEIDRLSRVYLRAKRTYVRLDWIRSIAWTDLGVVFLLSLLDTLGGIADSFQVNELQTGLLFLFVVWVVLDSFIFKTTTRLKALNSCVQVCSTLSTKLEKLWESVESYSIDEDATRLGLENIREMKNLFVDDVITKADIIFSDRVVRQTQTESDRVMDERVLSYDNLQGFSQ